MTPELIKLIIENRGRTLSSEEMEIQIRSFAFGDLAIEDPTTTRSAIDRAVDTLFGHKIRSRNV